MPLNRTLSFWEISFFATGVVLGAGIYTIVGEAAYFGGNMLWLSFLISALTALLTVFSYAELCAMYPTAGGEYKYMEQGFGKTFAVILGLIVACSGIGGAATISLGFAGYFSDLIDIPFMIPTIGIILLMFAVNSAGIRHSSTFNIVFTIIEVSGLGLVIYSGWDKIGDVNFVALPEKGIPGLFIGAALSFFAFSGFEDTVKLAEETKEPERNIPKGMFLAMSFIVIMYLLVVVTSISAVPYEKLAESKSPLAMIVETALGKKGALILGVIALFSTSNSILSNMLGASRVLYKMAKVEKMNFLSKVSGKTKTPIVALALVCIIVLALSLLREIRTVALISNFFVFAVFLCVNVCVIVLRYKEPDTERPFKIPFSIGKIPVISALGVGMILFLLVFTVMGLTSGGQG